MDFISVEWGNQWVMKKINYKLYRYSEHFEDRQYAEFILTADCIHILDQILIKSGIYWRANFNSSASVLTKILSCRKLLTGQAVGNDNHLLTTICYN